MVRDPLRGIGRLACVSAFALLAAVSSAPAQITYYLDVQYAGKTELDPTYLETTFDIFYPANGCLALPGCTSAPRPVVVMLHGGNANETYSGSKQISPIAVKLLDKGFVVVVPRFHVIEFAASESWLNATKDAARAIQFVRFYAWILNVNPNLLFVQGHSAGASHTLWLGLGPDYQNLASPDPVDWMPSRPNFIVPWSTATDFLCFDATSSLGSPSWTSSFFFGIDDFTQVPTQMKIDMSPVRWMIDPAKVAARSFTPPMCMVFKLGDQHACGSVIDPHDGKFGPLLNVSLTRYCVNFSDPSVCAGSTIISSSQDFEVFTNQCVAWMAAKAGL